MKLLSDDEYLAFILGVFGSQHILPSNLLWLGHDKAYNDPWVIEVSLKNQPIRFSFKFRQDQQSLHCCINLRPFAEKFGSPGKANISHFKNWVKNQYDLVPKNLNNAPYFKPYWQQLQDKEDTWFDISGMHFSKPVEIMRCPEFSNLNNTKNNLTICDAVSRILHRL